MLAFEVWSGEGKVKGKRERVGLRWMEQTKTRLDVGSERLRDAKRKIKQIRLQARLPGKNDYDGRESGECVLWARI